jgi:NAD-dependent SIR2 family protein deacetylase
MERLFRDIAGFNSSDLQHVETVEKSLIDLEEVRKVNPQLAHFYEMHVMPPPAPTEVQLAISNIAIPCQDDDYVSWTLRVKPVDDRHNDLIDSVVFDLHPTFSPSSLQVKKAPFSINRRGWGTFEVKISVYDIRGHAHHFSHHLTFKKGSNEHIETMNVVNPRDNGPSPPPRTSKERRMEDTPESEMHGHVGVGKGWAAPLLVTYCDELARPEYSSVKAHEYNEDPMTLREKVKVLAELIKKSKHFLAYTGAGISTASGIDDYASRGKDSVATGSRAKRPKKRGLQAEPTFSHFVLGALHQEGYLKSWVQQNHDGLPQKAGFSQSCLNEIHGAWFDPSNPVVPMSGSLRGDLFQWMLEEEQKADLVIALGTSLSGMNADRMVSTPSKKFLKKNKGLGSIIIGFQKTRMDHLASLRIFANIDEVMMLLVHEMQMPVKTDMYTPNIPEYGLTKKPHAFTVPYDPKTGKKTSKSTCVWDLSPGSKIQLTGGPGKGFKGYVKSVPSSPTDHYSVAFPNTREGDGLGQGMHLYSFGSWWAETCVKGEAPVLPFINI